MNLDEMSLRELQDLQRKVDKAIASYNDRIKREAYTELLERARQMGFKLEELIESQSGKPVRTAIKPKYRHPENWELTWSGRGRKPRWFVLALESGFEESDLLIQ